MAVWAYSITYRAMRRYLRQLFSLSFSTLQCPLEYFIASVVDAIPLPLEGGRALHLALDVGLIAPSSKPMNPVVFELTHEEFFPFMDLDFAGPLRCLSVDNLLAVFTLMLREAKILFICQSNAMLTEVMETLRALLFPLNWATCFVPRLPTELLGLMQTPGGFMIGINVPNLSAKLEEQGAAATSSMSMSYAHVGLMAQAQRDRDSTSATTTGAAARGRESTEGVSAGGTTGDDDGSRGGGGMESGAGRGSNAESANASGSDSTPAASAASRTAQDSAAMAALAAAAAAIPTTERGKSFYSTKLLLKKLHYARSLIPGTYVVDLTANAIFQYDGKSYEHVNVANKGVEKILQTLPNGPRLRLQHTLQKIASKFAIGPQAASLDEFDSAFDFQTAATALQHDDPDSPIYDGSGSSKAASMDDFPTLQLRDAFMAFMVDLLGDFPHYIVPPSEDLTDDTYRTFQEEFRIQDYLAAAEKNSRQMMGLMLETQMFSSLLQKRVERHGSRDLVFYERALRLLRELELSVGGHGFKAPSTPPPGILQLPAPVYALLDAEIQFTALGAARQRQLLTVAQPGASGSVGAGGDGGGNKHGNADGFDFEKDEFIIRSTGHSQHMLHYFNSRGGHNADITSTHFSLTKRVTNVKLDHLLTVVSFFDGRHSSHSTVQNGLGSVSNNASNSNSNYNLHAVTDGAGSSREHELTIQRRIRGEIQSGEDLHLDNARFRPLIIPGPSYELYCALDRGATNPTFHQEGGAGEGAGAGVGSSGGGDGGAAEQNTERFSYDGVWPQLQEDLLRQARQCIIPEVLELKRMRYRLNKQVCSILLITNLSIIRGVVNLYRILYADIDIAFCALIVDASDDLAITSFVLVDYY